MEGPSIVLLKEEASQFEGKVILSVSGNSRIDQLRLLNRKVECFRSWGKHFLICFSDFTLRVHFLMFGSYRINNERETPLRLSLTFSNGKLNLYSCSLRMIEGDLNQYYDWSKDVMNDDWDAGNALLTLKSDPSMLICDALLEQEIFSGVGNIIKNEVLYRVHVHPESLTGNITKELLEEIVSETRVYSFQFLAWKRNFELKKHFLAYNKKLCQRCNLLFSRKNTGQKNRRSFFCNNCQQLYTS